MTEAALRACLQGIRALVLDIDDTIIDTRGAMIAAGTAAASALWPDHTEHVAMAERYYADPVRWFRRYAAGEVAFHAMRAARLDDVAQAFGMPLPEGGHAVFEEAYAPAFRGAQRLFPDVPGLLAAADELGLPIALLTNSAAGPTRVKLEVLRLTERFQHVVTTDTIGVGKPDRRVYAEACRLVGVPPASAVCIGDSLEWDVHGAVAAGLRAIWLDRDGSRGAIGAEVVRVASLGQVARALRFGPPAADR